jgi:hypothetical protein
MDNNYLVCVLNLFGITENFTQYTVCHKSCVCDLIMDNAPECTDINLVDKFCPYEWFTTATPLPTTTTTTTINPVFKKTYLFTL